MDLIKQLKENRYAFGLWPEMYENGKEMQAKAKEIGRPEFLLLTSSGEFLRQCVDDEFILHLTVCLRPNYTEEAYEKREIFEDAGMLYYKHDGAKWRICTACIHPNFAGFLYEDGEMRPVSVRYFNADGVELFDNMPFERLQSGNITIKRPTHVIFKKEK